jgi:hypothetical protein
MLNFHSFFVMSFLYVCMCGSNACIANPSWIPGARFQNFFMGVVRAWGLSVKISINFIIV